MLRFVSTLSAVLVGSLGQMLAAEPDKGVDLKLISDSAAISAGEPFQVGLQIHHHEDHHTYWKNPGAVGFATSFDWKLPKGFTAGPIQWAPPEVVDMSGHAAHGYTRDVLLTAKITPPATVENPSVTLEAQIAWMACAEGCNPGDRPFTITLPVSEKAQPNPDTTSLFNAAKANAPKPLEAWEVKLGTPVDSDVIRLEFHSTKKDAPVLIDPYFFSEDGQISSVPPVVTTAENGDILLRFHRAEHSPERATSLPGILAFGPKDDRQFARIAPEVPEK